MRKVICDECKSEEGVNYQSSMPTGWCPIKITGSVIEKGKRYSTKRVQVEILLCDICVSKKFNFIEEEPSISQQFEDIATEYLQELSADAVQQAMENT